MNILQQGDKPVVRTFYNTIIQSFPKKDLKILNMGSGIAFELERLIRDRRKNYNDILDCVDFIPLKNKPDFINNYFNHSLEDIFYNIGGGGMILFWLLKLLNIWIKLICC